jgi:HD-GYP domain-containing protein (c-di-GMP phosphodiesterase class II)/HAMP domain-containing protein
MSVSDTVGTAGGTSRPVEIRTAGPATRVSLQDGIALAFTLLIAAMGITLIWYNYKESRDAALIAADDLFGRVTRQTITNVQKLYAPAEALVDLTVTLDAVTSDAPAERLRLLPYFAESLRTAPTLSSFYVGYPDGEFFQLRAVRGDDRLRRRLRAPAGTWFALSTIEADAADRQWHWLFYDENLVPLGAREAAPADYDPRERRWYRLAMGSPGQVGTGFYRFQASGEWGATLARRTPEAKVVVGADVTLDTLCAGMAAERVTPSTAILLLNASGRMFGHSGGRVSTCAEPDDPVSGRVQQRFSGGTKEGRLDFDVDGRDWLGSIARLPLRSGKQAYLAVMVPRDELLFRINELRNTSLLLSLAVLLVAIAVAWWMARRIARSLRRLAGEAQRIRDFKLDTPITVRSRFLEVDELSHSMAVMKSAIERFVAISKALSAEKDFNRLLERLLSEARAVCRADGGSIFLFDEDKATVELAVVQNERSRIHYGGTSADAVPAALRARSVGNAAVPTDMPEIASLRRGSTFVIGDIAADKRCDFSWLHQRYERDGYRCQSLVHLPLRNRKGELIGLLELVNARDPASKGATGFSPEMVSYVSAISSQAAITLDNQRLLKSQKDLLDAFIRLIAGAIDAKSPYTGGHCQRVPELARLLARAAQESEEEPFRDFALDEEEWYELHLASWLHDCGKVTTPENVVDKATKLECIYNRIHEIRMRFEVLWRDAQIEHYRALTARAGDSDAARQALEARLGELRDDYAFVAGCNEGGELMAPERLERLERIASQVWLRYFDDRLGLSRDELNRKTRSPAAPLPAEERLLADKQEHRVMRDDGGNPFGDNPHGFRIEVPQYAFNYGELYNLRVARGTLTEEERFKINEHIIQTIILLNQLPFPRELRRVPTWAGNHHEKVDGSGYPRRLTADDLSVPERIMAIADIFEALTASDRPYKKAKTLSESIRIMASMCKEGHICPDLFALFLRSGVYLEYAQTHLSPEQIDAVDVAEFLGKTGRA